MSSICPSQMNFCSEGTSARPSCKIPCILRSWNLPLPMELVQRYSHISKPCFRFLRAKVAFLRPSSLSYPVSTTSRTRVQRLPMTSLTSDSKYYQKDQVLSPCCRESAHRPSDTRYETCCLHIWSLLAGSRRRPAASCLSACFTSF